MHEWDGHISQSRDGVEPVSRVLGLVRSRPPLEVEEKVRLGGNFPKRYRGGAVGREGGDRFRKACCGRVYLRGGTYEP